MRLLLAATLLLFDDGLTVAEFQRLHKELTVREGWHQIPWVASIRQAREVGARERKPVFMTVCDGQPLALC